MLRKLIKQFPLFTMCVNRKRKNESLEILLHEFAFKGFCNTFCFNRTVSFFDRLNGYYETKSFAKKLCYIPETNVTDQI